MTDTFSGFQVNDHLRRTLILLVITVLMLLTAGCNRRWNHNNQPGTYTYTVEQDSISRQALIHIPDCHPGDEPLPLVVVFHGGGGSAAGINREAGWTAAADRGCFLVVLPEGLPPDPEKRSSFLNNPQRWNDGSGRFQPAADDIAFIEQLLDNLQEELAVDPERIFATGFSNGASMAYRAAVELDHLFTAAAPVAGALWLENIELDHPVSLLYITGTSDPLNPIQGGQPRTLRGERPVGGEALKTPVEDQLDSWAGALDCNPEPAVDHSVPEIIRITFQDCKMEAQLTAILLEGQGHHWPGGKSRLPQFLVGPEVQTLDGTAVIWDFFKSLTRTEDD